MNTNKIDLGIVVLCWNDPENTTELIESIKENDYKNFDIFIFDNNSFETNYNKLLENLKKKNYSYTIVSDKEILTNKRVSQNIYVIRSTDVAKIKHAENLGVTKGYNKGINFVIRNNYDFILKLDCDFILSKNLITGLIETFKKNAQAVAVSPKVYYYIKKKTKIIWWKGVNFTKNYFRFQRTGKGANRRDLDKGQFSGVFKSQGICGCCVALRSDVVKKTGLLDEDFFFGPEDIEHAFRLRKYGDLYVNLNYHAYHKVSQSIYVSGVEKRIYFETIGWLTLISKVCNSKDKFLGYSYFIIRGVYHVIICLYKKKKDPHIGFISGLKDYFLK